MTPDKQAVREAIEHINEELDKWHYNLDTTHPDNQEMIRFLCKELRVAETIKQCLEAQL